MGIKVFDLPPEGIQDGAVAKLDENMSTTSQDVKPEIITEQVSPEDPIIKKVKCLMVQYTQRVLKNTTEL